ncbi:MAG: tRNA (adenosine(37)-N6)-threonylcarbamoyltransferase complex ATPase subunit type 1 TsaE, partial [Christensenellaceae bacterium]|nr:tRNA (adenosine(37)-N6)-threonylcarbamoyltransferase complex ATPase subunit type 1 TsaE [Christensenellaceae bacterium]
SSPTYAIINKYTDNIFHADLYRISAGKKEDKYNADNADNAANADNTNNAIADDNYIASGTDNADSTDNANNNYIASGTDSTDNANNNYIASGTDSTDNADNSNNINIANTDLENTGIFDIIAEPANFVFIEWAGGLCQRIFPPETADNQHGDTISPNSNKPNDTQHGGVSLPNGTQLYRIKINILEGDRREFIID